MSLSASLVVSSVTSHPADGGEADGARERAVELADVGRHLLGDPLERLGLGDLEALPLDLLAQDGDAGLEVRPADVDHHALAEARAQALLERLQLARRPVAGDDDLLAGLVERVERVEELDLGLLLLGEELHVVDDEDVVVAVGLLEALDAALVGDRVDEVVGEALAGDVADLELRVLFERRVRDRLREVRLAEAGVGVDEHRVVGGGRRLGDAARHGGRVLVVGPGDEAVEDVARVEVAGGLGAAAACRRGRSSWAAAGPARRASRRRGSGAGARSQRRGARVDDDLDLDRGRRGLPRAPRRPGRRAAARSTRGRSRWARR